MDVAEFRPSPRPEPLRFTLPDDPTEISIPPVTFDQLRKALRLEPEDGTHETAKAGILRLCAQAEVLLGPSLVYLLDVLQPVQMRVVLAAIYTAALGKDAERYARLDSVACAPEARRVTYDLLHRLEAISIELCTALDKLPSELGPMPVAEGVELYLEYHRANAGSVLAAPEAPFKRH